MRIRWQKEWLFLALFFLWAIHPIAFAQDLSKVQIETVKVAEDVYMLVGAGGNIGVFAGEDGVLLVDSQFSELIEKIKAAVAAVNPGPIRFLINTNWHNDHVYGNEPLGKAGAVIIAHENTWKRMTAEQTYPEFQFKQPPAAVEALPVVTFLDSLTLHFNGGTFQVIYIENAHSDADVLVLSRKANVMQTGDLFFSSGYPFIDISHGGSVSGMIAAASQILEVIDENTKVIPGHGPLSNRAGVEQFKNMMVTVRDRIAKQIKEGKTLGEVLASKPTADFDKARGVGLPAEMFVKIVYTDLSKQ